MNAPKVHRNDYIDCLIARQHNQSCLEAGRVQPAVEGRPAHDAFTRLLYRREPDAKTHWQEASTQVELHRDVLVVDDSTLDKPQATKMELVTRHRSGKHHAAVEGINLITLLWTDGDRYIPSDNRIDDWAHDDLTKNDHFATTVQTAHARGFTPDQVLFDSWYSSLDNLTLVRSLGWHFCTRLKSNRQVNPPITSNRAVSECNLSAQGTVVHPEGYGFIKVCRIVTPHSATEDAAKVAATGEYWATSDLALNERTRLRLSENVFAIENYHRGLKQFCGVEKGQIRLAHAQRNHIGLTIRAFLRLESYCFRQGISWFEAKLAIVRAAVTAYFESPLYSLSTA